MMKTREMLTKMRVCIMEATKHNIPFCCAMNRREYEKYFDSEFMLGLPWDYVGIIEEHQDWYYHTTTDWKRGYEILEQGVLKVNKSNDDCDCGKAIYTFPCKSGRVADAMGTCVIKFKSKQQHVHIVNYADTTNKPLGECIFFEDVILEEAELLTLEEAIVNSITDYCNYVDVMRHYYGVDIEKPVHSYLPIVLMEKVINKPSAWYTEEVRFKGYGKKTYEDMLKRIELYEMQKENSPYDSFYCADLDFFRHHVEKALAECSNEPDDSRMNLF